MRTTEKTSDSSIHKAAANNEIKVDTAASQYFINLPKPVVSRIEKKRIQRTANFEVGTTENTWNLAERSLNFENETDRRDPGLENVVGLTVPILNDEELRGGTSGRDAAEFLDGPRIGGTPRRRRLRRTSVRMNNVLSYLISLPTPGRWSISGVNGSQILDFLSNNNQTLEEDISSESGLTFTVVGYPDNQTLVNETQEHELDHANDLENAFSIIQDWDERIAEEARMRFSERPRYYGRHTLYEAIGGSPQQIMDAFIAESNRLSEALHHRSDIMIIAGVNYDPSANEVTMVLLHRRHNSRYLGLDTSTDFDITFPGSTRQNSSPPIDFQFPRDEQAGQLEGVIEDIRSRRSGTHTEEEPEETNAPEIQKKSLNGSGFIQSKLEVGKPGDEYEQEADRVADQVMRMPEPFIQNKMHKEDEPVQTRLFDKPQHAFSNLQTQVNRKENSNSKHNIQPWKPVSISDIGQKKFIQRRLNYLAQLTGQQAAPFLTAFDATVTQVEASLVGVTGQAADDIRASMTRARALRTVGRVTVWQVSGSLAYASYDNASGELRLHDRGNISNATERGLVVHEAIHALHASQYPQISRLYGQMLAAGGTPIRGIAILLLQFKAWTEYWANRRSIEHHNIINPQNTWDTHTYALSVEEVRDAIARVTQLTESAFTPWTWNPPRQTTRVRRQRP